MWHPVINSATSRALRSTRVWRRWHQPQPEGHATLFGNYTLGDWSVDVQWHWFSGETKNGIYGAGQTYYDQNRVIQLQHDGLHPHQADHPRQRHGHVRIFQRAERLRFVPPYTVGSSGNPGSIFGGTPEGEDVMGRYFTIGVRGNL